MDTLIILIQDILHLPIHLLYKLFRVQECPNFNCLELAGTGPAATQVKLLTNVTIDGNSNSNALIFSTTNDVVDLNGNQLTLGLASNASQISGSGFCNGSASSSLIFNGMSAVVQALNFPPVQKF